jgi:hypothetical protein
MGVTRANQHNILQRPPHNVGSEALSRNAP